MEDIDNLDGVGAKTSQKLKKAGYSTIESIATAGSSEIANKTDIDKSRLSKIIESAKKETDIGGFKSGSQLAEKRKEIKKIKTLVPEIDELLGGGIDTQSITEVYGEFGSGKSQITHQLAVNVQLPKEMGGLNGSVIYIDTEDSFRPERIEQMVEGLEDETKEKINESKILERIHIAKSYGSEHQMSLVGQAKELAEDLKETEYPVRLFIVDSLTSDFRAEYIGRGKLADRQQKLNQHLNDLLRIANLYNSAVFVTNQVQEDPGKMFGDPTKPIGGHVLGHNSTYRIYLRKSKENKRIFKLVDAPELPDGEGVLRITEKGIKPE